MSGEMTKKARAAGVQPDKWVCGTLIKSMDWLRKFEAAEAAKQKWYCNCCHKLYESTKFGMVAEVLKPLKYTSDYVVDVAAAAATTAA